MGEERKIAKEYDRDGNGILDAAERAAARKALQAERSDRETRGGGARRRGGFWSSGRDDREPPARGIPLSPADVPAVPESVGLYDPSVLRTLFFEFESEDWEAELSDFARTDVEVPATLRVDGKAYPGVGVGFRGASSLFTVGPGYKRSLNVSIDAAFKDQRLLGYKTLNLLNGHSDPSFLHAMLFSHVARKYGAAPKVNLVRVVINGENWGIYVNAQQFDRIMIAENFPEADGARWKVPGSPRGRGGLEYLGTDLDQYERRFELKAGGKKAWPRLVRLCQALNETPAAELEDALSPLLDIDGALRFLAVDVVLVNLDGYWVRASDYSMFEDQSGRFHLMPHDMNEAFGGGGMPGGPRGRRQPPEGQHPPPAPRDADARGPRRGPPPGMHRGGPTLDPLVGLDDPQKPLRSKLLANPSLRARYLAYVRDVATHWLDWKNLGPIVARARELIDREVEIDTRKLSSLEAFRRLTSDAVESPAADTRPEGAAPLSLRAFAEQRRRFLLDHPEIRKLGSASRPASGGGR